MFPAIFLKSVCTQNFLCATFYQHCCRFRTTCMKCVQKHFLKENICALQVFCVRSSDNLCGCARAQLRGNIALKAAERDRDRDKNRDRDP